MAVSKRLRFEVMRRDGHRCQYCGAAPSESELTIDHVVPVTLGGSDDPSNLVTACKDCNAGKSASSPDAPLVAEVNQKAVQWGQAMQVVLQQRESGHAARRDQVDRFGEYWCSITDQRDNEPYPRDEGWRATIHRFLDYGLSEAALANAVDIAVGKTSVRARDLWRYFCGVCHNELKTIQRDTSAAVGGAVPAAKSYVNEDGEDEGQFPEFEVICEYLEHLVRALGGDAQVAKYVDRTVGTALSSAHHDWFGGIRDSEDSIEGVRASVRDAASADMAEIRKWREQRDRVARFPALNLADVFITALLEAFDATAEDRQTVHHAFWQSMEHAFRAHTQDEIPEGYDESDWVELDFECEMEEHLGDDVGQRRNHIVQVALARHYVQRVCELGRVDPELAKELTSHVPCVLNDGTQEFAAAAQRHADITGEQALELATKAMDDSIDTELTQQGDAAGVID